MASKAVVKDLHPVLLSLIACGVLVLVALVYDAFNPRQTAESFNNYSSAAFRSDLHVDNLGNPDPETLIPLSLPIWQSAYHVPAFAKTVEVEFRYHCEPTCEQLWLSMPVATGNSYLRVLVEHPIFHKIKWLPLHENGLIMYQRNLTYGSMEDFFKARINEPLLMDSFLLPNAPTNQSGVDTLEGNFSLPEGVGTIISTYVPPRQQYHGWATFRRKLEISQIARTPEGLLPMNLESAYVQSVYKVSITQPVVVY